MNVQTIREGLATACATVTGLRAEATVPPQVKGPTAIVNPDDSLRRGRQGFIEYNDAMAGGLVSLNFEVVLLVPVANGLARAQKTLDGYLSAGTGVTTSVVDAINRATIAGTDYQLVETARTYGETADTNPVCVSARLTVVVRANRR